MTTPPPRYLRISAETPLRLPFLDGARASRADRVEVFTSLEEVRRAFAQPVAVSEKVRAPFFIRAPQREGHHGRTEENLQGPWWVVLDIDKLGPPPGEAHRRFSVMGVPHVIYTTWSRGIEEGERYRVLTDIMAATRADLEPACRELFRVLGCAPTPESWNTLGFFAAAVPPGPQGAAQWQFHADLDGEWYPSEHADAAGTGAGTSSGEAAEGPSGPSAASGSFLAGDVRVIKAALKHIENVDRDDWLAVGMALHHAEQCGELELGEGRVLWDEWSAGQEYPKFNADDQAYRWEGFRVKVHSRTLKTIERMARAGGWVPPHPPAADDFGTLLDPDFRLARTREEINSHWGYVPGGGFLNVHALAKGRIKSISMQDFRIIYARDVHVPGRERPIALCDAWIKWDRRTLFTEVGFWPEGGASPPVGAANLWPGWLLAGVDTGERPEERCPLILRHIREVIADGNEEIAQWVLAWCAHLVQRPWEKPGTALVMRGNEGIGKGEFAQYLFALVAPMCEALHNRDHLLGKFNSHLAGKLLLYADELLWGGLRSGGEEGILKTLITEPTLLIEAKYMTPVQMASHHRFLIASNKDWIVPAGPTARRYQVLDVPETKRDDDAWFDPLRAERRGAGPAALFAYLRGLDLAALPNPRRIIRTDALADQKLQSLDDFERWVSTALETGELGLTRPWPPPGTRTKLSTLLHCYHESGGSRRREMEARLFGKRLRQVLGDLESGRNDGEKWVVLPPPEQARAAFLRYLHLAPSVDPLE